MSPEDAAAKWVDDNPDKVDAWLRLSRPAVSPPCPGSPAGPGHAA